MAGPSPRYPEVTRCQARTQSRIRSRRPGCRVLLGARRRGGARAARRHGGVTGYHRDGRRHPARGRYRRRIGSGADGGATAGTGGPGRPGRRPADKQRRWLRVRERDDVPGGLENRRGDARRLERGFDRRLRRLLRSGWERPHLRQTGLAGRERGRAVHATPQVEPNDIVIHAGPSKPAGASLAEPVARPA